jgi:hypothetical protein
MTAQGTDGCMVKTKDDLLKAVQKWYTEIAEHRELHNLRVAIRVKAGENKSREVIEFCESRATSALRMSSGRMARGNHRSIL